MKAPLDRARNYVYWLISKQSRTKKEILDKLKRKEYEEDVISVVVKEAEENGLINDKRYAFAYALDRMNFYKSGKNLVRMKLVQKGVEKSLIDKAIERAFEGVDEYAQALDIAKRLLDYGFHPPTVYFPLNSSSVSRDSDSVGSIISASCTISGK